MDLNDVAGVVWILKDFISSYKGVWLTSATLLAQCGPIPV